MSAILAKALNSTIGTDDFKSFDEILLSHKILAADSETIFCPLNIMVENMWPNTNETTVLSFKLPIYGSINLVYSLGLMTQAGISSGKYSAYMTIYKNEIQIGKIRSNSPYDTELQKQSFEITANVDDVITITLSSQHTTEYKLYLYLYSLNGKVIECTPVNIISKYGG